MAREPISGDELVVKIEADGSIRLPAELLQRMKLRSGTRFTVTCDGSTIVLQPLRREFIRSLVGITNGAGDEREQMHRDDEER